MKIFSEKNNIAGLNLPQEKIAENTVATIGFFDGIHLGHQYILNKLKEKAKTQNVENLVITMWQHPQLFFGKEIKLLNSLEEKIKILENFGIDNLIILDFNKNLAEKKSNNFIEEILKKKFKISELLLGYNNNFGSDCKENLKLENYNFPIKRLEKLTSSTGEKISSSEIRKLLVNGNIEKANEFLNYNYTISGTVGHGFEIGRSIGFPTTNIIIDEKQKLIPANGVYTTKTSFDNKKYFESLLYIGNRPSYNGNSLSIENHILNFNENVYEKNISISIFKKIRGEMKFSNENELIKQIKKDINTTKIFFNSYL